MSRYGLRKAPVPLDVLPDRLLESARLHVRPPRAGDHAAWAAVRGRNREFLAPFEPVWPEDCLSQSFFTRRLEKQAACWHAGQSYSFLIFRKDGSPEQDGGLVGGVNINNVMRGAAQFAALGYWLAEDSQGQGYMGEALRLIIGFSFGELRLHRLNAGCLPVNARSQNVLRRLGFQEEGFARGYLEIAGKWQDHVLFGLTVEEWKEKLAAEKKA